MPPTCRRLRCRLRLLRRRYLPLRPPPKRPRRRKSRPSRARAAPKWCGWTVSARNDPRAGVKPKPCRTDYNHEHADAADIRGRTDMLMDKTTRLTRRSATRVETDSFGPIEVPADRYWGAQTERSRQNFRIGEDRMPTALVHALGIVK